jgi:thiamine biosynthesis lipoprotein
MKQVEFSAMGSRMHAILDASSVKAETALADVPAWFEEWEQCLSRFRPDSELSCLNRSSGSPVAVSQTLWEVFQAARQAEIDTSDLVRPTLLNAILMAGYDRSFDSLLPDDSQAEGSFPEFQTMAADVTWDPAAHSLCLPDAFQLDLAGVAKGWAAGQAVDRLKQYGSALVNAGGDIATSGPRSDGQPWSIGVLDPFHPDTNFETLLLEHGAVATSGTDYHRWKQGKLWNHHIIDPRTGLSANTDLLSVTVIAPEAVQAEAAAKAVLILGSSAGMDWLEADPDLAGLIVLQFGEVRYSQRMTGYLWSKKCPTIDLMSQITILH